MTKKYRVDGLDCGNCAAKIERGILALDGVSSATVNFMTGRITVEVDDAHKESIEAEMQKIVRKIEPDAVMRKL